MTIHHYGFNRNSHESVSDDVFSLSIENDVLKSWTWYHRSGDPMAQVMRHDYWYDRLKSSHTSELPDLRKASRGTTYVFNADPNDNPPSPLEGRERQGIHFCIRPEKPRE